MRKMFLIVVAAVLLVSCGNSYIEDYEAICNDATEELNAASSSKEVIAILKQFRKDVKILNEENPEEASLYMFADTNNEEAYEIYKRRVKAYNLVNALAARKRHELVIKNDKK